MTTPAPPPSTTVGLPPDGLQVNNNLVQLARQIEIWAPQAIRFADLLAGLSDEQLTQPPYDFAAGDIPLLKSAAFDMRTLAQVYLGQTDHTPASDMSVFVKRVAGLLPIFG